MSDPLSDSLALGAIGDIVDETRQPGGLGLREMKSCSKSQDTRDWCSQINGALSIGVSSTGLSTGGSVAPSFSAASDETNSYYGRGDGDYQVKNYLKDLEAFKNSFHEPLSIAKECVSQVDDDLMTTFKLTELQAGELIVSAQMVTWKLSATACRSLELLPTLMWAARGHTEETDFMTPVSEVQSSIAAVRKDAQAIRTNYIDLLNQVKHLGQCTQVTLDQVVIAGLPEPVEDAGGNLEIVSGSDQPSSSQVRMEKCLELALLNLDATCETLEECSDFWLMLHSAELELRKIEKAATRDNLGAMQLQGLCDRLRDFCKEHCGVWSGSMLAGYTGGKPAEFPPAVPMVPVEPQ